MLSLIPYIENRSIVMKIDIAGIAYDRCLNIRCDCRCFYRLYLQDWVFHLSLQAAVPIVGMKSINRFCGWLPNGSHCQSRNWSRRFRVQGDVLKWSPPLRRQNYPVEFTAMKLTPFVDIDRVFQSVEALNICNRHFVTPPEEKAG